MTSETRLINLLQSAVSTYSYNATGDVQVGTVAVGTPQQAATTYAWTNGLLQSVTDPLGNQVVYIHDGRLLRQEKTYNAGAALPIDRKTYDYNAYGFVRSIVDLKGNTTLFGMNARGLVPWQDVYNVSGRPNAASRRRFKCRHFEELERRHLPFQRARLKGENDGASAQNGDDRHDPAVSPSRLV